MATLEQQVQLLQPIFGVRNQKLMPELWQRLAFMQAGMHNFVHAYDHRHTDLYASRLASLFARWVAAAESVGLGYVVLKMAAKYPAGECTYCHHQVCICPEDRPKGTLVQADPNQLAWSLRELQLGLGRVYGRKNRERGLDRAVYKLGDEIAEVMINCLLISVRPSGVASSGKTEEKVLLELADVFAWMCGVATMLEVDLEMAFLAKYGRGCPNCGLTPCGCALPEYVEGCTRADTVFAT